MNSISVFAFVDGVGFGIVVEVDEDLAHVLRQVAQAARPDRQIAVAVGAAVHAVAAVEAHVGEVGRRFQGRLPAGHVEGAEAGVVDAQEREAGRR